MDQELATRLAQQMRLFEAVASTTPDFIYVFDCQGRFQYANRGLLEVWGLSLDEVIGRTCLELTDGAAESRVDSAAEVSSVSSRRILVVDDNADAADSSALLLQSLGCEVCTVYGGEAAVREAQRFRPDVVLLDLGMPGVDGYQACRMIRETAAGAKMLIVAVSGWGRDADIQRSAAAGFDHHFLKPVDPNALMRLIGDERRVRS